MSEVEALAAAGSGEPDPISVAEQLGAILDLESAGWRVSGARIVGKGGSASGDLYLIDGAGRRESIFFERLRDVAKASALRAELAATLGHAPKLSGDQAFATLAALRKLAEIQLSFDADEIARGWGADYLQIAPAIDVDMSDQRERWGAFEMLDGVDPVSLRASGEQPSIAAAAPVLRDHDGTRYVRAGWFRSHVRAEESISSTEVANRMQRVGWERRGRTGRVKATRPDLAGQPLAWSFYTVPEGWEASE